MPAARPDEFAGLVERRVSAPDIARHVDAMVGELGFLVLARLDQGPLVSPLRCAKEMVVFLIGNPVLANCMYERDPGVGLYAPLRASIYVAHDGTTSFVYDVASSLLNFVRRSRDRRCREDPR